MATTAKRKETAPPTENKEGLVDLLKTVIYVVAIVVVIRTFLFEPFNIPSGSMIPTLLVGDYVFVAKYSYGYSKYSFPIYNPPFSGRIMQHVPERGDVAVFRYPNDTSEDYIKRIVGLPGDHIQVQHGILYVNGTPVERRQIDDFVPQDTDQPPAVPQYIETLPNGKQHPILQESSEGDVDNTQVFVVPQDAVFGMGDNRDDSADSRIWGFIPMENLVGKAEFRFFSWDAPDHWWEIWEWPFSIRYSRLFTPVR